MKRARRLEGGAGSGHEGSSIRGWLALSVVGGMMGAAAFRRVAETVSVTVTIPSMRVRTPVTAKPRVAACAQESMIAAWAPGVAGDGFGNCMGCRRFENDDSCGDVGAECAAGFAGR